MKTLSVRLDDNEFQTLSQLSAQLGETRAQVVKRSIAEFARQKLCRESPHALAERLGLIGIFDGPADLSESVAVRVKRKLRA